MVGGRVCGGATRNGLWHPAGGREGEVEDVYYVAKMHESPAGGICVPWKWYIHPLNAMCLP